MKLLNVATYSLQVGFLLSYLIHKKRQGIGKKTLHKVRKRIKTLTDNGVIRKFTVKVGAAEGAQAITLLATNPSFPTLEVSKKIMALPNVETLYEVTGEYDIVTVISGMNVEEVDECIEKIRRDDGIKKNNTMIVLRNW